MHARARYCLSKAVSTTYMSRDSRLHTPPLTLYISLLSSVRALRSAGPGRYTVLHEESAGKIRDDAPLEKAPLLACALPTGYGAVFNTAKVEAGSSVAVFGVGTVGLAIVEACKRAGANRIIAVDTNPEKFDRALTFGATECVNPKDFDGPIQDAIIDMTNGGAWGVERCGSIWESPLPFPLPPAHAHYSAPCPPPRVCAAQPCSSHAQVLIIRLKSPAQWT